MHLSLTDTLLLFTPITRTQRSTITHTSGRSRIQDFFTFILIRNSSLLASLSGNWGRVECSRKSLLIFHWCLILMLTALYFIYAGNNPRGGSSCTSQSSNLPLFASRIRSSPDLTGTPVSSPHPRAVNPCDSRMFRASQSPTDCCRLIIQTLCDCVRA